MGRGRFPFKSLTPVRFGGEYGIHGRRGKWQERYKRVHGG